MAVERPVLVADRHGRPVGDVPAGGGLDLPPVVIHLAIDVPLVDRPAGLDPLASGLEVVVLQVDPGPVIGSHRLVADPE